MTCEEFERVLPELEGDHNLEQHEHVKSCPLCFDLVSDLNAISQEAHWIGHGQDPSPRVWNSIENLLRQEGLIRDPQPQLVLVPPKAAGWRFAWLMPITAALFFGAGLILIHQRVPVQRASTPVVAANQPIQPGAPADAEEGQLLKLVASRAPAMRTAYESNLRAVDAYIHDAEVSVHNNPNDENAQQYLMNAYEQRAMVYEMAMDRSIQ